jgi:hypothetical protein
MIFAMVVASVVLASQMATAAEADSVQEQLRLMEQRMAEMEDRLQATSQELKTAKATVDEQQGLLSDAGLVEKDDRAVRSGVGAFLEMVDVSGVVAASYNYRFINAGDNDGIGTAGANGGAVNDTYFTHKNADTFQIDQVWLTLDKTPTEESRGGFHADYIWGETAEQQGGSRDSGLLYTGYVSYLAPVGNGVQVDAGKLATTLGAEVLQANANFNITNGIVFQNLQPFTHTGVTATTEIADGVGLVVGVVNEVYTDTNISVDRDKAGIAQLQFSGDNWGFNVGAIAGQDPTATRCDASETNCNTSVFDITATVDPTDTLSAWINFDWVRNFGSDVKDGDKFGIAGAARLAVTDDTGISTRVEYLQADANTLAQNISDDQKLVTVTGTVDHALTEDLKLRGELRWDKQIDDESNTFSSGSSNQFAGIIEMYYEF